MRTDTCRKRNTNIFTGIYPCHRACLLTLVTGQNARVEQSCRERQNALLWHSSQCEVRSKKRIAPRCVSSGGDGSAHIFFHNGIICSWWERTRSGLTLNRVESHHRTFHHPICAVMCCYESFTAKTDACNVLWWFRLQGTQALLHCCAAAQYRKAFMLTALNRWRAYNKRCGTQRFSKCQGSLESHNATLRRMRVHYKGILAFYCIVETAIGSVNREHELHERPSEEMLQAEINTDYATCLRQWLTLQAVCNRVRLIVCSKSFTRKQAHQRLSPSDNGTCASRRLRIKAQLYRIQIARTRQLLHCVEWASQYQSAERLNIDQLKQCPTIVPQPPDVTEAKV